MKRTVTLPKLLSENPDPTDSVSSAPDTGYTVMLPPERFQIVVGYSTELGAATPNPAPDTIRLNCAVSNVAVPCVTPAAETA